MDPSSRIEVDELLTHASWARALSRALVADPSVADDLVQDAWVAALRRPPTSKASLQPWLARVIRNLASDRRRSEERRAQRERSAARDEALAASDEVAHELELHRTLVDAVTALDEPLRGTILRHYFHGLSSAEIARRAGVAESTVRTRLQRGLQALRTKLDRRYGDRSTWALLFAPLARPDPAASAISPVASSVGIAGVITMSVLVKVAVGIAIVAGTVMLLRSVTPSSAPASQELVLARTQKERAELADESTTRAGASADTRMSVAPESAAASRAASAAPGATTEAAAVLEARAIDASGAPIAGAELVVVDRLEFAEIEPASAPRAKSGADGKLHLEVHKSDRAAGRGGAGRPVENWTIEVAIEAPARARHAVHPEVITGAVTDLGDIVLAPGGSIQGRVTTVDGSATPSTWVELIFPDLTFEERARGGTPGHSNPIATARLAVDGSYAIVGALVGVYRVTTGSAIEGWIGAVSEPTEVRAGETTTVPDLVLRPNPFVIRGVVLGPTGKPASNASVEYRHSNSERPVSDQWLGTYTKADGTFLINLGRASSWDIMLKGMDEKAGALILPNIPTGTVDLVVHLPVQTWLEFAVIDQLGHPITEFTASTTHGDTRTGGNPQGKSRVPVFPWPSLLRISAAGREEVELGPFDLEHHPDSLVVTLRPIPTIHGRVLAEGQPVRGAKVFLMSPQETSTTVVCNGFPFRFDPEHHRIYSVDTDADGKFAMTERRAGRFVVAAQATGYADARSAVFESGPGITSPDIELTLTRGGSVEGHVIPEAGTSAAGTLVGIARDDGLMRIAHAGADGAYRFEALAPGRWAMRRCERDFVAQGSYTWNEARGFDPSLQFFDIEEGRTTEIDLDLRGARCTLEGRLAWSRPTQRAWTAKLIPLPDIDSEEASVAVSADGTFHVEASRLGAHRLVLADTGEQGLEQRIEVTLELARGTNEWTLALATGSIEGEAAPGALLTHTWKNAGGATLTSRFLADSRGHFRIDTLPAGPGRMQCTPSQTSDESSVVDVPENGLVHVTCP